jgi:hypothetical protein
MEPGRTEAGARGRPEAGQRQARGRPEAGQRQARGRLEPAYSIVIFCCKVREYFMSVAPVLVVFLLPQLIL